MALQATAVAADEGRVGSDDVLDALDDLLQVIERNERRVVMIRERAEAFRALRRLGFSYAEIVPLAEQPLIVELVAQSITDLCEASGLFRRAEAEVLHRQGVTMERIAMLFGVTRQRVSSLLRDRDRPVEVRRR
jgi:hypothetical protein